MAAGIIDLCDQVASLIDTAWAPGGNDSVERVYQAPITKSELDYLVGRKVYVFPRRKLSLGAADRGSDRFNWEIGILAVERCTETGNDGLPTADWMDDRTEWMEATIEDAIDFDGRDGNDLEFDGRTLQTLSIETEIYDVDHLDESKLFWSELIVTFDEVSDV